MADHAAKLGFAAKLPLETEFYLGSSNLKTHLTALKNLKPDALVTDRYAKFRAMGMFLGK